MLGGPQGAVMEDIVQFCAGLAPPLEDALGNIAWWPAFKQELADRLEFSCILQTAQRQQKQQHQHHQPQHHQYWRQQQPEDQPP